VLQEALAIRTNLLGFEHPEVATSLWLLGAQRAMQDRLDEAEDLFRRSLALRRKFLGNEHPDVAVVLSGLSHVLSVRGKYGEAEVAAREALAIRTQQSGGKSTFDDEGTVVRLGMALRFQRRTDEAETVLRQALEERRKAWGADHPRLCGTLTHLAFVLMNKGKLAEAEELAQESLALSKSLPESTDRAVAWETLGYTLLKACQGRQAR